MISSDAGLSPDLASARSLSLRLAQEALPVDEPAVPSVEPSDAGPFVRLRPAARTAPAPPPPAAHPVPPMPAPPPGLPADELWGPLLDWCRAAARAESAFLLGAEGLLMECRGALSLEDAQGLGSQLKGVLERARRMVPQDDAARLSLVVEVAGWTLTGFAPTLASGKVLIIGFVGKEPVPASLRDEVFKGLSKICAEGGNPSGRGSPAALAGLPLPAPTPSARFLAGL